MFNLEETGLFWKRMPAWTFSYTEKQTAPGFKATKYGVTVMLGGNANGHYELKPAVICHAENPFALRGFFKSSLPVHWRSTKRG